MDLYKCVCCGHVCMYVYIYIERERDTLQQINIVVQGMLHTSTLL